MPRISTNTDAEDTATEVGTAHVEPATVVQETPPQPVPVVATPALPAEEPVGTLYDPIKDKQGVSFSTNNIATPVRTFTPEEHGDDWTSVAKEFFTTHQSNIIAISYL